MNPEARLTPRHGPLHWLFEGGIALKGLMGITEAAAGTALLLTPPERIQHWLAAASRLEIIEDRDGPLIRRMVRAAETLPGEVQHFYAIYLLLHGVMKLVMVGLLWARFAWAYPVAIIIQCFFVAFEMHRWLQTGNPVLMGLAVLDGAIIWLIWQEWRGKAQQAGSGTKA